MENELYFTSSALESGAEPGKDYGVKLLDLKKIKMEAGKIYRSRCPYYSI
jgi:hypothetical protein